MITFKQFIRENELRDDLDDDTIALSALLKGPCKKYLRQSQGNGLLFRGMDSYGELYGFLDIPVTDENGEPTDKKLKYYKKVVRKDRKPMSTTLGVHKIIDNWFEEEMGMKARSEAMFCYGESGRMHAAGYARLWPSVVFPIGKFVYCWSPKVKDLYDIIVNTFEDGNDLRARFVGSDGKPDVEAIANEMNDLGYTINNFDKAVSASCEIMIECEEYFVVPYYSDEDLINIKQAYREAFKSL